MFDIHTPVELQKQTTQLSCVSHCRGLANKSQPTESTQYICWGMLFAHSIACTDQQPQCERFWQNQNDLLGKTVDKRHVCGACLNRSDTESYCGAAGVLALLMVLNATYCTFQITFRTTDVKIWRKCYMCHSCSLHVSAPRRSTSYLSLVSRYFESKDFDVDLWSCRIIQGQIWCQLKAHWHFAIWPVMSPTLWLSQGSVVSDQ